MKNGAKWDAMDKLMIKEDFFSSRSRVQPGLPDLSNLSLSREAGRLIQLRLAESENWHGLVLISNVFSLISQQWWSEHRRCSALSSRFWKRGSFQKWGSWTKHWGGEVAFPCYFLLGSLPFVLLGYDFLVISYFL